MHYLDETHVFLFLVQVFVLLLATRLLGELFRRRNQPPLAAPDRTAALRELEFGTAVGQGIAIPHVRLDAVRQPVLVVARAPDGLEWDAPDGDPFATSSSWSPRPTRRTCMCRFSLRLPGSCRSPKTRAYIG